MTKLSKLQARFSEDPAELVRQIQEFERSVEEALTTEDFVTGHFVAGAVTAQGRAIRIAVEQQGSESVADEGTEAPVIGSAFYLIGVTYRGVKSSGAGITINVEDGAGNELFRVFSSGTYTQGDNIHITSTALVHVPANGIRFIYDAGGTVTTSAARNTHWFAQKVAG